MLDYAALRRDSMDETGLANFGGAEAEAGFQILVESLNREGGLSPAGAIGKRMAIVRAMSNLLRLRNLLDRNQAILEEQIRGPIVIVGLPRSGTTKLHRMIAADPAMQKLPLWKILRPVKDTDATPDPRIAIGEAFEQALRDRQPDLYAAHPMAAHEPDEDVFALEITGRIYINCSAVPAPSYKAWLDQQDFDDVYHWLRRIVQAAQFQDGAQGRPWVLKAPQHLGFLPELFRYFPNATVVHCHRRVAVSIASYAAMITAARNASCLTADAAAVGRYGLDFWSGAVSRYLADRSRLQPSHSFVDVAYQDIVANGMATIQAIYRQAGLPLTVASEAAMLAWEQQNAQHKHGQHRYGLAEAGLTEAEVAAAFAPYASRFEAYL